MVDQNDILQGQGAVVISADSKPLDTGLAAAKAKLAAFGTFLARFDRQLAGVSDFGKRVGSSLSSAGRELVKVSAAAALPLGLSTRSFMGFEDQMKAVQAVTGATGEAFDKLYEKGKELGRTTSFTAAEVASGMLNLARAGFSTDEIDAAIQGMLDLARATATDLAMSADIAAGTLRAFNLQAGEMGRVSDVLVATANNSAQTLEDLGESMKYVAPIALEYGLSLEQTSKALGVLANMSIKGTMAGTSLRQIMLQLSDPDVQKQLRGIGVEALDSTGNLRELGDLLIDVGNAMAGMTNAQRLALGKSLFDQRAAGAALKLAKSTFPQLSKAIDEAGGTARRTAEVMDSGLGGSFRRLTSNIEGVMIAIGEALAPMLQDLGKKLEPILLGIAKWVKLNKSLVASVATAVVAAAAIGAGLVATGIALKVAGIAVGIFAGAWSVAMAVVSATSVIASAAMSVLSMGVGAAVASLITTLAPIAAIVAAVGGLAYVIESQTGIGRKALSWLAAGFESLKSEVFASLGAIGEAMAAGDMAKAAKVLWALLTLEWTKGVSALKEAWAGIKVFVVDTWEAAVYRIASAALDAWALLQSAWHDTVSFMTDLWTSFAGMTRKVWGTVQNWLTKQWIEFLGLFDERIDVDAALRMADEDYARDQAKINAEMNEAFNRSKVGNAQSQAAIEAQRQGAQKLLNEQEAAEWQTRHDAYAADVKRAQDAVAAARKEWRDAVSGHNTNDVSIDALQGQFTGKVAAGRPASRAAEAAAAVKEAGAKAPQQLAAVQAVVGSFNLAAAFGLASSGGVQDRMVKGIEQTAENTRKIAENDGPEFT